MQQRQINGNDLAHAKAMARVFREEVFGELATAWVRKLRKLERDELYVTLIREPWGPRRKSLANEWRQLVDDAAGDLALRKVSRRDGLKLVNASCLLQIMGRAYFAADIGEGLAFSPA